MRLFFDQNFICQVVRSYTVFYTYMFVTAICMLPLLTCVLDVLKCRNADEILDIHEEMIELSRRTNTVCSQTKFLSVDLDTRYAVNDLPVTLCRPEENLSSNSTTVSFVDLLSIHIPSQQVLFL